MFVPFTAEHQQFFILYMLSGWGSPLILVQYFSIRAPPSIFFFRLNTSMKQAKGYCITAMHSSLQELNIGTREKREFLFIASTFESLQKSSIGHLTSSSYPCTNQFSRRLKMLSLTLCSIRILLHYSQSPQISGQLISPPVNPGICMTILVL